MPSKSLKAVLFSLFFIVFFTALYLGYLYQKEKKAKRDENPIENTVSLTGVVKKGKDITPQSSYCPSQLYILTENQNYQLRTPDDVKTAATTEYAKYRDSKVKITAFFLLIKPERCMINAAKIVKFWPEATTICKVEVSRKANFNL